MTKVQIGQTVRQMRQAKKMTTTQFAKKVGVSQAQISRLENGEQGFRSDVIVRMAKVLRVKPWALFMTDAERAAAQKLFATKQTFGLKV